MRVLMEALQQRAMRWNLKRLFALVVRAGHRFIRHKIRRGVRAHEIGCVRNGPGGAAPAGAFQHALLLGLDDEGFAIPDDPVVPHVVLPASLSLVGKNAATVAGDIGPYMTVRVMVSGALTGSRSDADRSDAETDSANYGCGISAAPLIARSKVSNARLSGVAIGRSIR